MSTQRDFCERVNCARPIERLDGETVWTETLTGDDDCIDGPTGRVLGPHVPCQDWTGE